jgi:hypothetical protein
MSTTTTNSKKSKFRSNDWYREREKEQELQNLKDEIEYNVRKRIDPDKSKSGHDYIPVFDKVLAKLEPDLGPQFFKEEDKLAII